MAQTRRPVRKDYPYNTKNMGYIDGSTVRKLAPAPYREDIERERLRREHELIRRQHEQRMRERQREHNQAIAMRNRAKVLKIDLKYTLFLALAVAATLLICIYYLSLQSQLTAQNSKIAGMKSELTALVDANLATQERVNNAIDLEMVYEIATEELGMAYPSKRQIIYYSGTSDDYVKQYKEIPQSK